jgi:hypothetical protein
MLHRRLFGKAMLVVFVGLPVALTLGCVRAANAEEGPHAHLIAAIWEMREAKAELKDERFKKHREQAEKDLDVAIAETEKALKEAKIDYEGYKGPKEPKEYYKAYKDFPHLRHAVVELREAKKEIALEKKFDFGRATKAIDVAIERVDEALKD